MKTAERIKEAYQNEIYQEIMIWCANINGKSVSYQL